MSRKAPAARGRRDANQAAIVRVFQQAGARVLDLSRVGGGCPDLLVNFWGTVRFVEVKTATGKLRQTQRVFQDDWPVSIVRSETEAVWLIRQWAKTA